MNLVPILLIFLLAFTSPVLTDGSCYSHGDCQNKEQCFKGRCLTREAYSAALSTIHHKSKANKGNGGKIQRNGGYGGEHSGPSIYEKIIYYAC